MNSDLLILQSAEEEYRSVGEPRCVLPQPVAVLAISKRLEASIVV